ncbi:MAG: HD domain-containing protein [Spirochaetales bacterium]|nr:HD domain-containing protein [Spirochaetales bacterium]
MEINRKNAWYIPCLYGLVVYIANYIGSAIPVSTSINRETQNFIIWQNILAQHHTIVSVIISFCYIIPIFFCCLYAMTMNQKNAQKRFINLPIAYSSLSITGWVYYYLAEIATLLVSKKYFDISIKNILMVSAIYIFLECLFSFTLGFFVMETLHRKIFLPRFFPEGKIASTPGLIKPSNTFLFTVFYISVSLFPLCFITFAYLTSIRTNIKESDIKILLFLLIIFALDIIILITFAHYYSSPLKKLKEGTEKVKKGDYTEHVKIVSNDSFGELADTFNDMITSIDMNNKKLLAVQNSILTGMATMVESRDNSTGGHIKRTSDCVRIFVNYLKTQPEYSGLSEKFCNDIIKAAPMHDLGKIAVPDAILQKPGKFTDEEYEKMKMHSAEGARIVGEVLKETDDEAFKKLAINVAHYHHEKWNGQGYPEKLTGEQIPFEARIMALADVFDALVSKRCYKESFSFDKAFEIISESAGSHFDPALTKQFIQCRNKLGALYSAI